MTELLLKRALLEEYEEVLKIKRIYIELTEGFSSLLKETLEFTERNNIEVSEKERLNKIIQRTYDLFEASSSPEMKRQPKSPDYEAIP